MADLYSQVSLRHVVAAGQGRTPVNASQPPPADVPPITHVHAYRWANGADCEGVCVALGLPLEWDSYMRTIAWFPVNAMQNAPMQCLRCHPKQP